MIESELKDLESQIDSFVESFQQLATENNSLRKQIAHLNRDRAALLDKKQNNSYLHGKDLVHDPRSRIHSHCHYRRLCR